MSHLRNDVAGLNRAAAALDRPAKAGRWPHASEVQSLLFSRNAFTPHQARAWARRHDFGSRKVDVTEAHVRIRQADPSQFSDFRTITLTDGVQAVVGPRR